MAKKRKAAKKSGRGRDRPSTRGPTVQLVMRLSKDLNEKIEALRKATDIAVTKTAMVERLLRDGIEKR